MKFVIQNPCRNEAETLPQTPAELSRTVEAFDTVEWLIIDFGSTGKTVEAAREHGVDCKNHPHDDSPHYGRVSSDRGGRASLPAGFGPCTEFEMRSCKG